MAVDRVTVTNQKPRRFVIRKRLDNLLSSPLGRRMLGDIEVHDAPTIMARHDERVQYAESCCGHREEVSAYSVRQVIPKKRAQVCDGGFRLRNMYLSTVVSDRS